MPDQSTTRQGVLFALAAYFLWGIAPIYFKSLDGAPANEVLSHRVIWSFFLLLGLVVATGLWPKVRSALKKPQQLVFLTISSLLIGLNWLVFIWAVNNDHMLDASLGYYINPIFNVLLGMLFLGERLRKGQWFAVTLAIFGVAIQVISFGSLPWVSLVLACSFGFYGLIRKKVNIDAISGLLLETLLLLPVALVYLFIFADSSSSDLSQNSLQLNSLLIAAGVVTTVPLLCFTAAATRLKLSTLGFFQYIGPSIMFILAVVLYDEPLEISNLVTFTFIWAALLAFSLDGLLFRRKQRQTA